jgi:hypothetical protein
MKTTNHTLDNYSDGNGEKLEADLGKLVHMR